MDKSGAAVCEFYVRIYSLPLESCTVFMPQGESQLSEGRILSLQACQGGQNYCVQGDLFVAAHLGLQNTDFKCFSLMFPFPALVEGLV